MPARTPPPEVSLLELVRTLSAFAPARVNLRRAPWDTYVDWAIANGLGPLAAYNLEYRLTGGGAPEWVRDRLLSVYQGSVNDNVMKLVAFKRAVDELQGRRILLLGAASHAEVLYPHIAFRPVTEVRLHVSPADLDPFTGFLRGEGFRLLEGELPKEEGAVRGLTDDHLIVLLYDSLLGPKRAEAEAQLVARAQPVKVYGPSMFRPELEDAILLLCLEQARAGYQVPLVTFVDLREMLTGARHVNTVYSRPPDLEVLKKRAAEWRIERALYTSLSITGRLLPETEEATRAAMPELRGASKALLDRLVVEPVTALGGMRVVRGVDRLRRLLAGG